MRRLGMWAIACTLLLAACTPSSSEETTTTTSEPPATTTTSSTTTTTIPVSVRVLEAFQANLLDEEASFRMDMTMDFEFGGIEFDATGWTLKDGSNQHSSFEMEFVGGQTEVLLVGPDLFARSNESVWVRTDAESALADTPSIGVTDENTRKLIEALEYIGTEEVEGETLHRLEVSDQTVIDPNTLGIAPGTINDPEVSMALYADDEGIPQRWTIEIKGTSPNPLTGEEADLEVAVLIIYSEWGESRDIVAPDSFWESVDSDSMGFTAAVPPGWDTEVEPPADGFPESYTTFTSRATSDAWSSISFLPSSTPFLKAVMPLPTSPMREEILPRPKRSTRSSTTIRICQTLRPISPVSLVARAARSTAQPPVSGTDIFARAQG